MTSQLSLLTNCNSRFVNKRDCNTAAVGWAGLILTALTAHSACWLQPTVGCGQPLPQLRPQLAAASAVAQLRAVPGSWATTAETVAAEAVAEQKPVRSRSVDQGDIGLLLIRY